VVIRYSATGVNLTAPSSVGRRQHGGPVWPGKVFLVGEHGPEYATFGAHGYVSPKLPAPRSYDMPADSAWGRDRRQVVELHLSSDGSQLMNALVALIRKAVVTSGGDVDVVLGTGRRSR
jgi:hypothetical protein